MDTQEKTLSLTDEAHEVYCLWADMLHGEFASNRVAQ